MKITTTSLSLPLLSFSLVYNFVKLALSTSKHPYNNIIVHFPAHLAKLRRNGVTVDSSEIVRLLGGSAMVDAENVEQLLPGTLHGLQRTGVARPTPRIVAGSCSIHPRTEQKLKLNPRIYIIILLSRGMITYTKVVGTRQGKLWDQSFNKISATTHSPKVRVLVTSLDD